MIFQDGHAGDKSIFLFFSCSSRVCNSESGSFYTLR